ncbi:MAG: hypothetical protein RBR69_10285 [Candidatus Cloacimonadaceae bacterium]|nr:hypothetical protein [Candidatus Cloacimonadaceae bacterium]
MPEMIFGFVINGAVETKTISTQAPEHLSLATENTEVTEILGELF